MISCIFSSFVSPLLYLMPLLYAYKGVKSIGKREII
uniref:Uncharacterized protein n=1 Tax=Siphoviridae sp. ctNU74 TaxID=2825471 RepID=A0A8S5NXC6_9CAUD|nr:MAG TPA: hypothetical protein [Siphoviridae sp. ctNU74]DAH96372.1 MAG TPA: hypothetical protein [Caudoviricetes sp.]